MTKADMDYLIAAIPLWRENPVDFVQRVFQVDPTEQQKAFLLAIAKPGAKVSVKSGHGTGKSTTMAWVVLWFLLCYPNAKIPCTAPSAAQLKDVLWSEIAKWHSKMPAQLKELYEVTQDRVLVADTGSFAVARTARKEQPEALQGFHADNIMFLIDEASGVPDQIFEVARGALSTPSARVVMASNPTLLTGYFYNSHNRGRDNWTRFTFSCLDSPLVAGNYAEEMAAEYGRDSDVYRVRVLGEFPSSSSNQLIPLELVEKAQKRNPNEMEYNFAPKIIGVDVAWEGDDRSVIFLRQGVASKILWSGRNTNLMTLGGIIARYEDEERADAVFIDKTGVGAGVLDFGRSLGRQWIGVGFGETAINETFHRRRMEMWWNCKVWLEDGGVLPNVEELKQDLIAPSFSYLPNGKMELEAKKDTKARLRASPDFADALVLTFAEPVVPRHTIDKYGAAVYHRQANTNYDIWG